MKTKRLFFLLIFLSASIIPANKLFAVRGKLMAGTAKVNITPKSNELLHDSLFARILVLDVNSERLAFISVDLAIYTSENLKKIFKEKFGITHLMISSSHTHSGPQKGTSTFYEEQMIKLAEMAVRNMFNAKISAGHRSFPQLGFNRLIIRDDGHARESWYSDDHYSYINPERIPFGPVDPEVGVIKIEDLKGQTRVIMMNYAAHADAVCQNYAISADYPGAACRKVEEAFGNKINCLFVQGAAGNIAPLYTVPRRTGPDDPFKTDYAPMERMGELLAFETVKLAKKMNPGNSDETDIKYMTDSLKFTGRFNKALNFNIYISTILINNEIVIATCPGETFIQLQLDWKKKIEDAEASPFMFGYTWNGGKWPGYVADIRSAALGGYGADMSQASPDADPSLQSGLIEVGAGEIVMLRHLENFYRLNGLMREKPGPVGFVRGPRWIVTPVPRDKK
jgi:neutral ceramidase